MQGVDGAEASASALIHDLASLLQCDPSPAQALPVLKAISGAIDQLLPCLPPSFLEPILPPNSLNNHQVRFHILLMTHMMYGMPVRLCQSLNCHPKPASSARKRIILL